MRNKIMIMTLLCALLVGLVPPSSAQAEEGVVFYDNLPHYLSLNGFKELTAYDSNKVYLMYAIPGLTSSYDVIEIEPMDATYVYCVDNVVYFKNYVSLKKYRSYYSTNGGQQAFITESISSDNVSVNGVVYSDLDIYTSEDKSEVWQATNGRYSFEEWCLDAGLLCEMSGEDVSSDDRFIYNQNYIYVVIKKYNGDLLLTRIFDSAIFEHWLYWYESGASSYLSMGSSGSQANEVPYWNYIYDNGWKFLDSGSNYVYKGCEIPDVGCGIDDTVQILYSRNNIYTDIEKSDLFVGRSTEYVEPGSFNPNVTPTPVPSVPPSTGSDVEVPEFDIDWSNIGLNDIPEVVGQIKDAVLGFFDIVGVVPLMIGAVFGFLPSWCLWMFGLSFALLGVLLVVKLIRG